MANYTIEKLKDAAGNNFSFRDTSKYTKPSGGIPKSDLASAVQTSLGLADSALQSHQSLDGYVNNIQADSTTTFGNETTIVVGKSGKNILTRTALALWTYIKGKADSVYAALSHTHTKSQITDFPTALSGFTDDLHSTFLYGVFITASVSEGYWCKFLSLDDTSSGYNSFPVKIDVMGRERVMYTCMFRLNHNSASSVTRAEYFAVGGTSQATQENLIGYVKTDRHYDFYFLNKRSGSLRYKVTTTNLSIYNLFTHPSKSTVVQQTAAPTGIVYFTNMFYTLAYKDGTNATGTWDIAITKNAATASSAGSISIEEIGTTEVDLDNYIANDGRVHYYCWSNSNRDKVSNKPTDAVYTVEVFVQGAGSLGNYVIQKAYRRGSDEIYVRRRSDRDPYWSSWKRLVYGDGSNASGTWGINISGNAATASALSIPGNKGNNTTPIYYNGNTGQFEVCSPSSMSVGNATEVVDYGNTSLRIKIGYSGPALTSTSHLAAYTTVNGQNCIKDISPSNVTVGNATKWNGYNIVVGSLSTNANTISFL